MHKTPSLLCDYLPEEWHKWKEETEHEYFYNKPTEHALEKSEMRLDELRPIPIMDVTKAYAISIVDKVLEIPLTAPMLSNIQVIEHMEKAKTMDKGIGIPLMYLSFLKCKTRRELMNHDWWKMNFENLDEMMKLLMIVKSTPKEEWATAEDFLEEKARTFFIPGFHILYWQLRLFAVGTENMMNWIWSRYGFNPFRGGVNKIARSILVKDKDGKSLYPIRWFWDIKGYDRKVDLSYVADRRYRYFCKANKRQWWAWAKWITDGLKASLILMTNGDIVWRKRGNNSGSGMTTVNNIEAGFEIVADLLVTVYYRKYNAFPTQEEVFDAFIMLYGDDNLGAVSIEFDGLLDRAFVEDRLLRYHGLMCKAYYCAYDSPLKELSFLGFSFIKHDLFWYPLWKRKRLLLCLTYSEVERTTWQFCQQFYSVLILCFGHRELWEQLRKLYMKFLLEVAKTDGSFEFKAMVRLGVPDLRSMVSFYQGLETMEGGGPQIYNLFQMTAITNNNDGEIVKESKCELKCSTEDIRDARRNMGTTPDEGVFLHSCGCIAYNYSSKLGTSKCYLKKTPSGKYAVREVGPNGYELFKLLKVFDNIPQCTWCRNHQRFQGSFNPYGNEQFDYFRQLVILYPEVDIINAPTDYVVSTRVVGDNAITISNNGAFPDLVWDQTMSDVAFHVISTWPYAAAVGDRVDRYVEHFSDNIVKLTATQKDVMRKSMNKRLQKIKFQTINPKINEFGDALRRSSLAMNLMADLDLSEYDPTNTKNEKFFNEGGFNPYGNGQRGKKRLIEVNHMVECQNVNNKKQINKRHVEGKNVPRFEFRKHV